MPMMNFIVAIICNWVLERPPSRKPINTAMPTEARTPIRICPQGTETPAMIMVAVTVIASPASIENIALAIVHSAIRRGETAQARIMPLSLSRTILKDSTIAPSMTAVISTKIRHTR